MTLQFIIVRIASAINDRLQRKLDYVGEERRILQEQLDAATGGKKLSSTARRRRRLAEAGKLLTPAERQKCCHLVKPAQSPDCNPSAERFVKTIRSGCLNHLVFFGERHLHHVVRGFMAHYHAERFHQGLAGQLIQRPLGPANQNGSKGKVVCRQRLGGMLNFYVREAG
jgi:hypothetical protein